MTAEQRIEVRSAQKEDGEAMLALLPRLAAFEIPNSRTAEHLWMHDAALMREWIAGKTDNVLMHVAEDEHRLIVGLAMVTLRPELLSLEPSAHLEAIAVSEGVEGQRVGQRRHQERIPWRIPSSRHGAACVIHQTCHFPRRW